MSDNLIFKVIERHKLELRYDEDTQTWFILGYRSRGKTFVDTVENFYREVELPNHFLDKVRKKLLQINHEYYETTTPTLDLIVRTVKSLRDLKKLLDIEKQSTTDIIFKTDCTSLWDDIDTLITTVVAEQIGSPIQYK